MAQAKCYAYMYGLMYDLSKLSVQVRYYNLDTKETKTIKQAFGLEELKTFLRSFGNLLRLGRNNHQPWQGERQNY